MIVEIVSTGTELLLGQIVNTNAPYLARKLNELGYDAVYQTTVGDNRRRMASVMAIALERADIVITSGGLGPTQGDITKEVSAELLGLPLLLHEESVEHIRNFFARRQLTMTNNNLRQAMMPEGAIVVTNHRGTAPGVIIEHGEKTIIHLPGPPMELEHMFETSILPYFAKRLGGLGVIFSRVYELSASVNPRWKNGYVSSFWRKTTQPLHYWPAAAKSMSALPPRRILSLLPVL